MKPCYVYLRTSGDDGKTKQGLPVQRDACTNFAAGKYDIQQEFTDDGVTGKLPMSARPAGKLLISALLSSDVKTVITYCGKRIGRTQPAFWSFIGFCRDAGITVLDSTGVNLCESVQGGINGLMAEMDRDATVKRLSAGKAHWRGQKRVDGRHPFGMHPSHEFDHERSVVERILQWRSKDNLSLYRIAWALNAEGVSTRCGKKFGVHLLQRIIGGNVCQQ